MQHLNVKQLQSTLKRLRKSTKNFSRLLVRDTFDHIDYLFNQSEYLSQLSYEVTVGRYVPQKPYLLESPKSKGINRPTIVLDIEDAIIYRFCIESIQDELFVGIDRSLARGGMKLTAITTPDGDSYYEKWFDDWMQHNSSIEKGLQYKPYLVSTDITSYYDSINILLLKDLVRSKVKEKNGIVNLLFFFIEYTKSRQDYEVNTFNGLLQEDIDCSRILAYFFLAPHDEKMKEFCSHEDVEFYRFVDDMSILVNSAVQARKALKTLTCSLRRIGLISSIEKTSIMPRNDAIDELFTRENENLSKFESTILDNISKKIDNRSLVTELKEYYKHLKKQKSHYRNWSKVLKRFYTLFSYTSTDILLEDIDNDIINYPTLFVGESKILKYLVMNKKSSKFNKTIHKLINYLYSEENLYPAVETSILEILLQFNMNDYSESNLTEIKKLANDILFKKNYIPHSDYTRALACLVLYSFNKNDVKILASHYCNAKEDDQLFKKYLIAVSLTVPQDKLRTSVQEKAKTEQGLSINRLISFLQNIDSKKLPKVVREYLRPKQLYVHYSPKEKQKDIKVLLGDKRKVLLQELIDIYAT